MFSPSGSASLSSGFFFLEGIGGRSSSDKTGMSSKLSIISRSVDWNSRLSSEVFSTSLFCPQRTGLGAGLEPTSETINPAKSEGMLANKSPLLGFRGAFFGGVGVRGFSAGGGVAFAPPLEMNWSRGSSLLGFWAKNWSRGSLPGEALLDNNWSRGSGCPAPPCSNWSNGSGPGGGAAGRTTGSAGFAIGGGKMGSGLSGGLMTGRCPGTTGVSGRTATGGVTGAGGVTGRSGALGAGGVTGRSGALGALGAGGLGGRAGVAGGAPVGGLWATGGAATGALGAGGVTGRAGVAGWAPVGGLWATGGAATGALGAGGVTGRAGVAGWAPVGGLWATGGAAAGVRGAGGVTGRAGAVGWAPVGGLWATGGAATGALGAGGVTGRAGWAPVGGLWATGGAAAGVRGAGGVTGRAGAVGWALVGGLWATGGAVTGVRGAGGATGGRGVPGGTEASLGKGFLAGRAAAGGTATGLLVMSSSAIDYPLEISPPSRKKLPPIFIVRDQTISPLIPLYQGFPPPIAMCTALSAVDGNSKSVNLQNYFFNHDRKGRLLYFLKRPFLSWESLNKGRHKK